jgi:hypothetical protein
MGSFFTFCLDAVGLLSYNDFLLNVKFEGCRQADFDFVAVASSVLAFNYRRCHGIDKPGTRLIVPVHKTANISATFRKSSIWLQ